MYYTVAYYSGSYVGRSDMDGKNSIKLIVGNHVDTPDGLAIDHISKSRMTVRLYKYA